MSYCKEEQGNLMLQVSALEHLQQCSLCDPTQKKWMKKIQLVLV
jgi:hypothetical protein